MNGGGDTPSPTPSIEAVLYVYKDGEESHIATPGEVIPEGWGLELILAAPAPVPPLTISFVGVENPTDNATITYVPNGIKTNFNMSLNGATPSNGWYGTGLTMGEVTECIRLFFNWHWQGEQPERVAPQSVHFVMN